MTSLECVFGRARMPKAISQLGELRLQRFPDDPKRLLSTLSFLRQYPANSPGRSVSQNKTSGTGMDCRIATFDCSQSERMDHRAAEDKLYRMESGFLGGDRQFCASRRRSSETPLTTRGGFS